MSPSDVYLDGNDKTVVQPDLYVVCDYPPKLTKNGYLEGAPAFIAEVLSPSTRTKDMFLKAYKYSEAGVAEYWIIDPQKKRVLVYQFGKDSDNDCDCIIYGFEDIIPVGISDGLCSVDFSGISKLLTRLGISE